jgi:SPP1 gp7 family putative phage head morphogenesis protein
MILASKIALKRSENNEKQLTLELATYFKTVETEVQRLLQEYGHTEVLLQGQLNIILSPIKQSHGEYYDIIRKYILREFDLGTQEGDRLVELNNPDVMAAEIINEIRRNNLFGTLEYSEEKLLNQTFEASQQTIERIDETINKIITEGYKSGKGIDYVARELQERFQQLKTWEAVRIARTEIHTAHNQGIMKSYETLGVEYTQWISAHDKRVRGLKKTDKANHVIMDGEIIPFGGTYSNGLRYPGDKSGKIEEWINCRCSNAPYVMPSGMMAPPGMSSFKEKDLIPISN